MRQYQDAKRQYPGAIVFFRMGDFYEMFYEDALVASRALELTLTSRSKDASGGAIPMCGLPYHALDTYLPRLVRKGYRVAICEQVEDPRRAKGLVKREVVRVFSPGTLLDAGYLDAREPSFLLAIAPGADRTGVALLDLSTGEFTAAEYVGADRWQALNDELSVLRPREIVAPADAPLGEHLSAIAHASLPVTGVEPWHFELESARRTLLDQLRTARARRIRSRHARCGGVRGWWRSSITCATRRRPISRTCGPSPTSRRPKQLLIDPVTLEHLEVLESSGRTRAGSLLDALDRTVTPMGGRLLRSWLLRPLVAIEPIRDRLDAVEELAFHTTERGKFRDVLKAVLDLERLVARAALGVAGPRDLVGLKTSLYALPRVRLVLGELQAPLVRSLLAELDDLVDLRDAIERTIVDDPPALARDGGAVRDGVDAELDELRTISRSGKQVIAELEERERVRTGIASLKVRFNRVFGYYIEISKTNLHAVPADYMRKQTIAGGERFITPALKEHEEKVLGADERIAEHELAIFERLRAQVAADAPRVQDTARAIAALDTLAGLAETATIW